MDTLVKEIQTRALIGDSFEAGEGAPEPIVNPRTGQVILEVAEASEAQVIARYRRPVRLSPAGL